MATISYRRLALGTVVALLFASVAQLLSAPTAFASGACGIGGSYQIGFASAPGYPQPYAYHGAMATITDGGGYHLCTGVNNSNNFATAWVMLFAADSNGWAQAGTDYSFGNNPDCVRMFSEQVQDLRNGPIPTDKYYGGCVQPGDVSTFWVQTLTVNGQLRVRSNVGTVPIQTSTFSPDVWSLPLAVGFGTEAPFAQTNVPGTTSNREDYAALKVQLDDLSYQQACYHVQLYGASGYSGSAGYHSNKYSCNEVQTWGN